MRVVLDTVILVRSLINPYGRWGQVVFAHADAYLLVVSPPILAEYLEVLQRPELTRKYRSVATRDPHAILDLLTSAEVVELADVPPVSRDPKDDPFLATAQAGNADYLVSEDRDLLDLGAYESTSIIAAAVFLELLETKAGDDV